jgi:hypothetical protein
MNKVRTLLVLLCLPLSLAAAEVYSWIDADGVKHFTQDQPPKGVPFRRLPVAEPGPAPAAGSNPARKADTTLGGGPKTREAGLKLKAETLERCAKARERIAFLEEKTARRLFRTGPDGEQARYTDEEFEAELAKARELEAANCI